MKKTILPFLFIIATQFTMAQLSPKVTKGFPAPIVIKIYDVASKIAISEEKQIQIGKKLQANDSLANLSLSKAEPLSQLQKFYPSQKNILIGIVSNEELDAYLYEFDKKNRFLLALKSYKNLELNAKQMAEIRKQDEILDSLKIIESTKKYQFFNHKLDTILNKKQYTSLLKLVYWDRSKEESNIDWKNIQKLKLVTAKDTSQSHRKLFEYYLEMNSFLDPSAKKYDSKKNTEFKNLIVLEKQPPVLTRYNILSNFIYKINIFSSAIQYEKELKLNNTQIDTLLSKYKELELMKYKDKETNPLLKKTDTYALFENKAITSILDPKQIESLLAKKNEKNAIQIAQENWIELEKLGLTKGQDKNSQRKEFAIYQLRSLMANEQLKMNKNPANMFRKRDVELKKPELLKQLDSVRRSEKNAATTKSELRW